MSANPNPHDGPSLAETQAELRAVSRKLSSCEAALEGEGSYLGIRDPAKLLGQLETLQKKDEQLREVLLVLLRAAPQAPPPPAAAPAALLPLAPSTHPPSLPSPDDAARGQQRQQPPSASTPHHGCSRAETVAQRASSQATAAATAAGAAARLAPLPSRIPHSPPGVSPAPVHTGTGCAKSVSLHDALGISPPGSAAAGVGTGLGHGGGGSSGDSSSAPSPPAPAQAVTYRPGQHALYRLNNARGSGDHGSGKRDVPVGPNTSARSGAAAAPTAQGSGAGGVSSGTAVRRNDGNGDRDDRAAGRAAARNRVSSLPSRSSPSSSSSTRARASLMSTGGPPTAAAHSAGASSAPGGRAASAGVPPSQSCSSHEMGESRSGGDGGSRTRNMSSGGNQEAAAAAAATEDIKEELREDIQPGFRDEASISTPGKSSRLLVEGLARAGARAAAKVGVAAAERPWAPTMTRGQVHHQVKAETGAAIEAAVNEVLPDKPMLGIHLSQNMRGHAMREWEKNFEIHDGPCVKRRAVDRTRRLPRPTVPPLSSSGSDAVGVVETVALDDASEDEQDRIPGPSRPSPPPNEELPPSRAAESVPGTAPVAGSAERQPVEAQGADGLEGDPVGSGQQPQQPSRPASSLGELVIPGSEAPSAVTKAAMCSAETTDGSCNGVADTAGPPERPARKRRKSAEAGGWRARYNKNEFESGDALLLSSDGESDDGWTLSGAARERASGNGGVDGGGVDDEEYAESDDLVDVGVEEDGDLYEHAGGDYGNGSGGGARKRKVAVHPVKKLKPPNAWKRRCADGDCLLGASFGMPGTPAKYCSAHKDAGMVNVTHRRCEEPGCERQPSFNIPELKRPRFCGSHKKAGMVNVSSPRCDAEGCTVRPSFGFEGDRRAFLCDAHKEPGMINIRKRSRRRSSGSTAPPLVVEEQNPVTAAAEAWRRAQLAAAAAAAGGSASSLR